MNYVSTQIWLVTSSRHYYPNVGMRDWQLVTCDHDEAIAAFEAIDNKDKDVYLICIEVKSPLERPSYFVENMR